MTLFVQNSNLYADDTELEVTTAENVIISLQIQVNRLNTWFKHNRLPINASKCSSMLVGSRAKLGDHAVSESLGLHIFNDPIRNFSSYKYLGLHIDSFLSFDDMISHICNKLRSRVAIIQRIRYLIPSDYLSSLNYAFIQPFIDHVDY